MGPAPYGSGLTLAYLIPYGDGQNNMVRSQPVNYVHEPVSNYGPGNPQMAANAPPRFRAASEEQINIAPTHAEPITTLIFKDGRPPVQVQNYALTTSILYALDGELRHEIPLTLLDVPATVTANRATGVDFALPVDR